MSDVSQRYELWELDSVYLAQIKDLWHDSGPSACQQKTGNILTTKRPEWRSRCCRPCRVAHMSNESRVNSSNLTATRASSSGARYGFAVAVGTCSMPRTPVHEQSPNAASLYVACTLKTVSPGP
jgi:hypothetical protein